MADTSSIPADDLNGVGLSHLPNSATRWKSLETRTNSIPDNDVPRLAIPEDGDATNVAGISLPSARVARPMLAQGNASSTTIVVGKVRNPLKAVSRTASISGVRPDGPCRAGVITGW